YIGGIATGVTYTFGEAGYVTNPDPSGHGVISITSMAPCVGAPNAGVASVTSRNCASEPFTLSVAGATKAGGISYQWERSDSGLGVWQPIPGATASTLTVTNQTVTSDYRFVVVCAPSTTTSYSNIITVVQPSPFGNFYEDFNSTTQGSSSNGSPP